MSHLGVEHIIDLHGCDPEKLEDFDSVVRHMLNVAEHSGMTVIDTRFHKFSPHGISGVVVISESHFAVHTWPEHHFAAFDFFSCDLSFDVGKVCEEIKKEFGGEIKLTTVMRGETT